MMNWLKYLEESYDIPDIVMASLFISFFAMQCVGEFLEFVGRSVPEFMKIRKRFARKKKEREDIKKLAELAPQLQGMPETLASVQALLASVETHYSDDNISKRNCWIEEVNSRLDSAESVQKDMIQMLTRNTEDTQAILIDNKRNEIINFAALVIDENRPVTREQFNRVFKLHREYEEIIEKYGLVNGEVDIAIRIIKEAYETHLRNGTFIEDIRGYTI